MKTNATRILDTLKIAYELRDYEVDPDDLRAEKVAAAIRLPPEQVFKTLAVRGEHRGVLLAVVPCYRELDFKALSRLAGDKSVEMVPLKEVQPLTGYIRGGVTALACKKDYPVFADETIELLSHLDEDESDEPWLTVCSFLNPHDDSFFGIVGAQLAGAQSKCGYILMAIEATGPESMLTKIELVEIIPGKGSGQLKKKVLRFLNQSHIHQLYHRVEKDDKNFGRIFIHFKF